MQVMVLEQDHARQAELAQALLTKGFQVLCMESVEAAECFLRRDLVDVLVLGERVGGRLSHSLALLAECRNPMASAILLTERTGPDMDELFDLIPALYAILGRTVAPSVVGQVVLSAVSAGVSETAPDRSARRWAVADRIPADEDASEPVDWRGMAGAPLHVSPPSLPQPALPQPTAARHAALSTDSPDLAAAPGDLPEALTPTVETTASPASAGQEAANPLPALWPEDPAERVPASETAPDVRREVALDMTPAAEVAPEPARDMASDPAAAPALTFAAAFAEAADPSLLPEPDADAAGLSETTTPAPMPFPQGDWLGGLTLDRQARSTPWPGSAASGTFVEGDALIGRGRLASEGPTSEADAALPTALAHLPALAAEAPRRRLNLA